MAKKNGKNDGIGDLNSDERGSLSDMRTPFARMPLKNDVAMGEAPPSTKPRDPLGHMPKDS